MKTILSFLIAVILICSTLVPAFAAKTDQTAPSATANSEHMVDTTYTITIPAYIEPNEKGDNSYSVTAKNVLVPKEKKLRVSIDYDGQLAEKNGVELPYGLYKDGTIINGGDNILTVDSGKPDDTKSMSFSAKAHAEPKYSGTYTDIVTFNSEIVDKTYTLNEINADEHLYAIGKTKSEYVVAKFNDDYTSVDVFKNGEASDGLMADFNTMSGSPFSSNSKTLASAIIKDGVASIGDRAFEFCSSLTNITIPNSITNIGDFVFFQCEALTSITIPDSVTSIGDSTFYACSYLASITIGSGLTSIGRYSFCSLPSLEKITVSSNNKNYISESGVLFDIEKTKLIKYPAKKQGSEFLIPSTVTSIEEYAFERCKGFTSITIPDNVTTIGQYAFSSCTVLKNIIISNSVEHISYGAFSGCYALTSVTIPDSVTSIDGRSFDFCESLTSITIPNSIISINDSAFRNCKRLKTVKGFLGSYAESWAKEKGYEFVPITT